MNLSKSQHELVNFNYLIFLWFDLWNLNMNLTLLWFNLWNPNMNLFILSSINSWKNDNLIILYVIGSTFVALMVHLRNP